MALGTWHQQAVNFTVSVVQKQLAWRSNLASLRNCKQHSVWPEFKHTPVRQTRLAAHDLCLIVFKSLQLEMQQPRDSRLKARIVVKGDFVVHVFLAFVHVVVVLVGSANECTLQQLRVILWRAEGFPAARSWPRRARAATGHHHVTLWRKQ